MATKEQYEFFKALYEDEDRTYTQLEARAKLYLSIISLFLAAILLKAVEVQGSLKALGVPWKYVLVEAVLLAGSLLFVVLGVFIRTYEGIANPKHIIDTFGDEPPSNEEFFDDRIIDYAVAAARNARVNNRTGTVLTIAAVLLGIAMLQLVFIIATALAP